MKTGNNYFELNNVKYGAGTKIQFSNEFYKRNAHRGFFYGYPYSMPRPSIFDGIVYSDGKTIWYFNNCVIDNLVWSRDVVAIVEPVYYIEKTDKDRIREKKEKGLTWSYIWPGTLVYIFCMLIVIPIFNERVWGWIAATIIYRNYYYEQMTRQGVN